jgi:hypothetical protein
MSFIDSIRCHKTELCTNRVRGQIHSRIDCFPLPKMTLNSGLPVNPGLELWDSECLSIRMEILLDRAIRNGGRIEELKNRQRLQGIDPFISKGSRSLEIENDRDKRIKGFTTSKSRAGNQLHHVQSTTNEFF